MGRALARPKYEPRCHYSSRSPHPIVAQGRLIPILAVEDNTATPAVVLTVYACLGALPHANVRWTYGRVGRILISPAYYRIHHSATGRLDINLGTVFAIWDVLSRRAVFPGQAADVAPGQAPAVPSGRSRSSRQPGGPAGSAPC